MARRAGDTIREARRLSRMSQSELARRAGVSQPVISAYERGHREPGLATLSKLVEATGHHLRVDVVRKADAGRGLPDTPMGRRLRRHRRALTTTAERRGATNLRVFGSVARGDDTEDSDIDLLVDLSPDVGLVGLAGLERELAGLLGRPVDIVPASSLKSGIEPQVLAEAIPL
ncbi:helix-turn-helix domain-containing protein [Iamia sp.]|uniref:helix-turn-helix domain-containing protein n=1 Tax=Iamia sp. TaxID=2722710 RepID=UPI002D06D4AE|nr:helix-turn-helix domain-containing protein [Iamia sp.]HXH58293.1 helix-turn-helix domain-containing protein [Iamia sp.]